MAVNARQKVILRTMGIPVWAAHRDIPGQKKDNESTEQLFEPETERPITPEIRREASQELEQKTEQKTEQNRALRADQKIERAPADSWSLLQDQVNGCTNCELNLSRTNPVFGVGNKQASLMIVGEAPGHDEDLKAEPFVGEAGHVLDQMLFSLGLSRYDVYIANIIKCHPPNNRKPLASEIEACSDYLLRQINLVKPRLILTVGAVSTKKLLHSREFISELRGKVFTHQESSIPLVPTYHPAYLLRKPTEKRTVWRDLLLVKKMMAES